MKNTEENNSKKFKKKWLLIGLAILFILGAIGSSNDDATNSTKQTATPNPSPTTNTTEMPTEVPVKNQTEAPTEVPTEVPTETPADTKSEIETIAKDVVGDNLVSVTYNKDNNFVLVKFKGSENLTNKMTVKGMYMDIKDILEKMKDYDKLNVDFNVTYTMLDTYGNTSDDIVIKASYPAKVRNKINWDNFLWENIGSVASDWWIHTALKNALNS